jgi:hypothetical protein
MLFNCQIIFWTLENIFHNVLTKFMVVMLLFSFFFLFWGLYIITYEDLEWNRFSSFAFPDFLLVDSTPFFKRKYDLDTYSLQLWICSVGSLYWWTIHKASISLIFPNDTFFNMIHLFMQEDVQLMVETGLDAFRFSISWSRLIPSSILLILNFIVYVDKRWNLSFFYFFLE